MPVDARPLAVAVMGPTPSGKTAFAVELARQSIVDVPTALLLLAAAVLLIRFRVNSTWLILGGAVVGLVLGWV